MLELPVAVRDAVVAHARRDHPDECCGVLTGRAGRVLSVVPLTNAERSPTGFSWDSGEWLRAARAMDARAEDWLAVYHSHTATAAYPSRTDVRFALQTTGPDVRWLIVSTRPELGAQVELRAYTIQADGSIGEEEVRLAAG